MPVIALKRITLANFKSFRGTTTIDLERGPGLRLLTGTNEVHPRLGANGIGKSSLWDAVMYCFYSRDMKGHRAADLVSWGEKRCSVEVVLTSDGAEYSISRTGSPDMITINGSRAVQVDVETIVVLGPAAFVQSVLFGQNIALFADVPVNARGDMLDGLLDLEVWTKAADLAKLQHDEAERMIGRNVLAVQHILGQLEALQSEEQLQQDVITWDTNHAREVDAMLARAEAALGDLNRLEAEYEAETKTAPEPVHTAPAVLDRIAWLSAEITKRHKEAGGHQHGITTINRHLAFITENEHCPVCKQAISKAFQAQEITSNRAERGRIVATMREHEETTHTLTEEKDGLDIKAGAERVALQRYQANIHAKYLSLTVLRRQVDNLTMELDTLMAAAKDNPFRERLAKLKDRRTALSSEMRGLMSLRAAQTADKEKYAYWQTTFRRVRLFQIKNILDVLTLEAANAASSLGLKGWNIQFVTETETRGGSIKTGVQISVAAPDGAKGPWTLWSGGEGQRLRLAISMGVAATIQRLAGVTYSFEVWDEPSVWLSAEGIDDLLDSLRGRAIDKGKAVWLLDHRALAHTGFEEVTIIRKTAQGSRWGEAIARPVIRHAVSRGLEAPGRRPQLKA